MLLKVGHGDGDGDDSIDQEEVYRRRHKIPHPGDIIRFSSEIMYHHREWYIRAVLYHYGQCPMLE